MKHPNILAASSAADLAMGGVLSSGYNPVEFGRKGEGDEPDIKQLSRDLKAATEGEA